MDAEVKKWGNSYAVRLPKAELERLGLHEGDHVEVSIKKASKRKKKVDLSHLHTFQDAATDVSENHDEYLYGGKR